MCGMRRQEALFLGGGGGGVGKRWGKCDQMSIYDFDFL